MPRKKLIRSSEFPYHITTRSNNKEWFYIPIEDVWKYCNQFLEEGVKRYEVVVHAFVLMSNHYHLCLHTPLGNIDEFMWFFNKNLGRNIANQAGRVNRVFGAPYKWTLVTRENYFQNVIRYIYQNPLRANLCCRCEDYPYSDIREQNLRKDFFLKIVNFAL